MYYCVIDCRVWDVSSGQMLNTLVHHCEAVLHLRFSDATMVTCSKVGLSSAMNCSSFLLTTTTSPAPFSSPLFSPFFSVSISQDRTIAVWDMRAPHDIVLRRVLVGHRAAVNVVDFDDRYIVSASGDRTIKV